MCDFCATFRGDSEGPATVTLPADLEPTLTDENQFVIPLEQANHVVGTELRRIAGGMQRAAYTSPTSNLKTPFGLAVVIMSGALLEWADQIDPSKGETSGNSANG